MSVVANLTIEHKAGDTMPRRLRLRLKQKTGIIEPYDLKDCSVAIRLAGDPVTVVACSVVDEPEGIITIPVGSMGLSLGDKGYSIVITHEGGEIRTHTEGVIKTTARKSG